MLHLNNHVARAAMLVLQGRLDVVDGRIRHPLAIEHLQPFLGRAVPRQLLDADLEFVPVGDTASVGPELLVVLPLGSAKAIAENAEQPVVSTAE